MSFWEKWFSPRNGQPKEPVIRFGRYTDSYKEPENYVAWDQALQHFEAGDYLDSYRAFFRYLRDESEDNVQWREKGNVLEFEFYQGSKRIIGEADERRLRAEAPIARVDAERPGLMRRLVEQNYQLKYGRFALDPSQHITLVFDTDTNDASPYKLYYALKEVAIQADKQDDLLLEEFRQLEPVGTAHLEELPEQEREIKRDFIAGKLERALRQVDEGQPDPRQHPGAVAYLLLALVYKIDYLTKPEGYTMETLERVHRLYFTREEQIDTQHKNTRLVGELRELLKRTPEDFYEEMYRGRSTFGITLSVTHDRLVTLIDNELHHMDWYQENGLEHVALAVADYIVGYCLFNYAVPQPDRDLLHLYFRIVENDYFRALGFQQQFCEENRAQLNRRAIRQAINDIADRYQSHYTRLRPSLTRLQYDNLVNFARSYLLMVRDLDLARF